MISALLTLPQYRYRSSSGISRTAELLAEAGVHRVVLPVNDIAADQRFQTAMRPEALRDVAQLFAAHGLAVAIMTGVNHTVEWGEGVLRLAAAGRAWGSWEALVLDVGPHYLALRKPRIDMPLGLSSSELPLDVVLAQHHLSSDRLAPLLSIGVLRHVYATPRLGHRSKDACSAIRRCRVLHAKSGGKGLLGFVLQPHRAGVRGQTAAATLEREWDAAAGSPVLYTDAATITGTSTGRILSHIWGSHGE